VSAHPIIKPCVPQVVAYGFAMFGAAQSNHDKSPF